MPVTRTAETQWTGDLPSGGGTVSFASSGLTDTEVTWKARSEGSDAVTSPEELIAAAHSSCLSMALTAGLAKAGATPESVRTKAEVTFQPGDGITGIHLTVRAQASGITPEDFAEAAEGAKQNCPVSKALAGTEITLDAALED
jgi:lipoyl-dependent peroxiredoxin